MSVSDRVTRSRLRLLDFLVESLADTPSESFVRGLFSDEGDLPDAEVNEPLDRGFERLAAFRDEHGDRPPEEVWRDIVTAHAELYLGGDPQVPDNEAAYREAVDADAVARRYEAADWSPPGEDDPDAVAVELAFLRRLAVRQREEPDAFETERAFLDDHLLRWVDDFAEETYRRTDSEFYRAVASVLLGVTTFEAALVAEHAPGAGSERRPRE